MARSRPPEKIALADLDTAMTQDVVGGGGVEIEVRQHEADQELLALERQGLLRADRKGDILLGGRVDVGGFGALHIVERLCDARLQLVEALFLIGILRRLAGPAPGAVLWG